MYASRVLSWRTVSKSNPFRHTVLEALEILFVIIKFDPPLPTYFLSWRVQSSNVLRGFNAQNARLQLCNTMISARILK